MEAFSRPSDIPNAKLGIIFEIQLEYALKHKSIRVLLFFQKLLSKANESQRHRVRLFASLGGVAV